MRRKIIIPIFLMFSLFGCTSNNKEENRVFEEPEIVTRFFNTYNSSQKDAINEVFNSSEWLKISIGEKQKDSLITQLNDVTKQLGNYKGYEIIKYKPIGNSYKLISSIAKYERQPIRFNFILYKPDSLWQVQNFTYDFNIEEEIENNTNLSFDY